MSYARKGLDGSDVYVYLCGGGYYVCHECLLRTKFDGLHTHFVAFKTQKMLGHLVAHTAAGHYVSTSTRDRLRTDERENDAWIKRQRRARAGER